MKQITSSVPDQRFLRKEISFYWMDWKECKVYVIREIEQINVIEALKMGFSVRKNLLCQSFTAFDLLNARPFIKIFSFEEGRIERGVY